jgi:transcriptional regulator with XRE-family HTH domain
VLDASERDAVFEADQEISGLQEALEAAVQSNALDAEVFERIHATVLAAAGRVNARLPFHVDADARDEIRRRLLDLVTLQAGVSAPPLDVADRFLLEAEAIRHVLRELLDEQPLAELRDGAQTIALLEKWVPGLAVKQLAELLGVSERQLQRMRHGTGPSSHRIQVVARLVAILRHAWTDQGVYAWFQRPRADLGGGRPIGLLDDPANERVLLLAARAGRVQGGV